MEKYGAEVEKYEVVKIVAFSPDDKKVVAENLSFDDAIKLQKQDANYMLRPMK